MVCFINPQSFNNIADYDYNLLKGVDLDICYICNKKFPYNFDSNIKVKPLFSYDSKFAYIKAVKYIFNLISLLFILLYIRPNVIHIEWMKLYNLEYFFYKVLKKIINCKIVYTAHNVLPHDTDNKYKRIFWSFYTKITDKIIVHCKRSKDEIVSLFSINEQKLVVIPHGLVYFNHKDKIKIKKNKKQFVFSFLGNLLNYKGIDILLKAWMSDEHLYENDKLLLVIAGKGNINVDCDYSKAINIDIRNYFIPDEELTEIIMNTDVGVLPYKKISQSGVLISYIAEKIPVIVSDIGGLTQPFELGNCGWILENNSVKELAELLIYISNNNDIVQKIKRNKDMWEIIHSFYSWKTISTKTVEIYQILSK